MTLQRLFSLVCILTILSGVASGQSDLSISGRLTDCETNRPVPDGVIRINATPDAIVTDENGSFRVYGLKPGSYEIEISAPAYYDSQVAVVVYIDRTATCDLCLKPLLYYAGAQKILGSKLHNDSRKIVIDRRSPEFQSASTVAEILDQIPNLIVNSTAGNSGEASVSVRGGPSKEVLVLLDGVRINSPITGVADVNSIPLSNVSRVEFQQGGSSSQFGAGAVGGVLSIFTTMAYADSQLELDGSAGSHGAGSASARATVGVGDAGSASASYSRFTAKNDFMYEHEREGVIRRRNADIARRNSGIAARLGNGNPGWLHLSYMRFDQKNGLPGFLPDQFTPEARKEESRDLFSASIDGHDGKVTYDARYSFKDYDQRYRDRDTLRHLETDVEYADRLHQIKVDAGYHLDSDTRFDVSATGGHESFTMENFIRPGAVFDDVLERRAAFVISADRSVFDSGGKNRFSSDMLLRARADYSSLFDPLYSPSIQTGINYSHWIDSRCEVSYGKSFRPPLYTSLFWNDGVFAIGNPDLRPERLEESSAALSVSAPILGELKATVRYTHSVYRDLIYWLRTNDNKFTPRNLSGALVVTRTMNIMWRLDPLNLTASYSNTDQISKDRSFERTTHDKQLMYRPRFIQDFTIRYESSLIDCSYRIRSVSKRFIREANSKWLDGYTVADFRAALKYHIKWFRFRLQYTIDNSTGTEYMLIERYPLPVRLWSIRLRMTVPFGA